MPDVPLGTVLYPRAQKFFRFIGAREYRTQIKKRFTPSHLSTIIMYRYPIVLFQI